MLLYVLATLYRDSKSATSAGPGYFLPGGLSSGLILLESALINPFTGDQKGTDVYRTGDMVHLLISPLHPVAKTFTPYASWMPVFEHKIFTCWSAIMMPEAWHSCPPGPDTLPYTIPDFFFN